MIKPSTFGLPEKFTGYRPGQFEIEAKMAASPQYAFFLDAPTGTGKSLIGATIQKLKETSFLYIATTKQLQDQMLTDFPYARTLKGRSNYKCLKFLKMWPNITAEDCTNSEMNPCELKPQCPYQVAKMEALNAPIAVLNTAYFLTEANYVGTFSGYKYGIIDEFDTVEDNLMSFIEVTITQKQLDKLEMEPPKFKTKFESWVEWANDALRILVPRLNSLDEMLNDQWQTHDFALIREAKMLSRLVKKLSFFVKEVDANWVWYPSEDRWVFKPVWIAKYASTYLWEHIDKVFGMSATILDAAQIARNIGLDPKNIAYRVLSSPFPKENRPVYFEPVANVVNKEMDRALPLLARRINQILDKHADDKVLIHTVSYKITRYLMDNLPKGRIMTHTTFDRADVLQQFKASPLPKVLISPSMDRGVDLPGDECRAVIIAKVPYPDLGDPQVKKRVYASQDGNNWYAHKSISKLIQMSGRGVRGPSDYAATYILDGQFGKLYQDKKRLFPPWFKEAIVF